MAYTILDRLRALLRPGSDERYCNEYVCLSVCFSVCSLAYLQNFVDDVMFSHSVHITRHVYSSVAIEYDKHNIRDSRQIWLNDKDQQILIVNCRPGAKSAVYDCFILYCFMFILNVFIFYSPNW